MLQKLRVIYAGSDDESEKCLQVICREKNWILQTFGDPTEFVDHLRANPIPEDRLGVLPRLRWMDEHIVPVVLDLDYSLSSSLEKVLEIKSVHGAIPVTVVASNVSLSGFSVARMDGADALFLHPIDPIKNATSISETITAGFERIARWRTTLGCGSSFCSDSDGTSTDSNNVTAFRIV